jgi:hypothetical protein
MFFKDPKQLSNVLLQIGKRIVREVLSLFPKGFLKKSFSRKSFSKIPNNFPTFCNEKATKGQTCNNFRGKFRESSGKVPSPLRGTTTVV